MTFSSRTEFRNNPKKMAAFKEKYFYDLTKKEMSVFKLNKLKYITLAKFNNDIFLKLKDS